MRRLPGLMGPKCHHKYPYKREVRGSPYGEQNQVTIEAATGVFATKEHKPRSTWYHQKLEEAMNGFSPRDSGGSTALLTP